MFTKILIANRGEIACRIITTAKKLGIRTVALYSDADKAARHVAMADEAFYIGASAPSESYLKGELILAIAQKAGAEAIHPGYGFLSENAPFARQCEVAGIRFIGPSSAAIEAMGSKSAAKIIMSNAQVPLVPGYHGDDQSDAVLISNANDIGFPLLIKAAFGGGGKGMRIVEHAAQLNSAIDSARREASSSFGNDKLLIERYLREPRHVEVQVFADTFGNTIYLGDRDCSIQRRHQKVVEEAPAPGLSAELKAQMGQAAVAAAKAINYVGAGTVEFLLGSDNRFYFMEMNTRLQVEHPVTEMITGQDLVHWQLLVASGQPLPLTQEQVQIRGHAFEARIYAEDPHNHFLPASGKLEFLREPKLSPNVRIDSGVREHDVISNFYDPMIAKLIVWDESRPRALQRLAHALESYHIAGLKHNVEFLTKIATHPEFAAANFSTDFIERFGDDLLTQVEDDNHHAQALACAALYQVLARKQAQTLNKTATDPHSPWNIGNGFRINSHGVHTIVLLDDANHLQQLRVNEQQDGYQLVIQDKVYELTGTLSGQHLLAEINGHKMQLAFSQVGDDFTLFLATGSHHFKAVQRQVHEQKINAEDKLKAPMNGTIAAHLVAAGDTVVAGQGLLVMEAMKMEYTITAPFDGTVSAFFYAKGELVKDGSLLVELRPADLVQSAELTLTEPASAKAQEA